MRSTTSLTRIVGHISRTLTGSATARRLPTVAASYTGARRTKRAKPDRGKRETAVKAASTEEQRQGASLVVRRGAR